MNVLVCIAAVAAWAVLVVGLISLARRTGVGRPFFFKPAGRSLASDGVNAPRLEGEQANTVMSFPTAAEPASTPPIPAVLSRRFAKGQAFARNGQYEDALIYYLWCYHTGSGVPEFSGVRRTALLRSWMELGQHYTPALEAAHAERDQAEQRILSADADGEEARDFAALNRYLKEPAKTLEVYDGLPLDDPRRFDLASAVFDELVAAQRYTDAVRAKPFESMSVVLEDALETAVASPGYLPSVLVRNVARSVEALAGSGEMDQARCLADRVLSLDGSPQAWEILRRHAARAGRADLLPPALR